MGNYIPLHITPTQRREMGLRIKARRDELNLTQEALTRVSGVSIATIQKLEGNDPKITGKRTATPLSMALKVHTKWLWTGEGPKVNNLAPTPPLVNHNHVIGKAIKTARLKLGMTQEDLAKAVKTTLWTIHRVETGAFVRSSPKAEEALAFLTNALEKIMAQERSAKAAK